MIALLFQVRRREIDYDRSWGNLETTILHSTPNAVTTLTNGRVGQADNLHLRQTVLQVDLDLDRSRVDTPRRRGRYMGKHSPRDA